MNLEALEQVAFTNKNSGNKKKQHGVIQSRTSEHLKQENWQVNVTLQEIWWVRN